MWRGLKEVPGVWTCVHLFRENSETFVFALRVRRGPEEDPGEVPGVWTLGNSFTGKSQKLLFALRVWRAPGEVPRVWTRVHSFGEKSQTFVFALHVWRSGVRGWGSGVGGRGSGWRGGRWLVGFRISGFGVLAFGGRESGVGVAWGRWLMVGVRNFWVWDFSLNDFFRPPPHTRSANTEVWDFSPDSRNDEPWPNAEPTASRGAARRLER